MTILYSELLLSHSLSLYCYINRITYPHTHMIVKKSMYRLEMNAKKFIRTRVYLLRSVGLSVVPLVRELGWVHGLTLILLVTPSARF